MRMIAGAVTALALTASAGAQGPAPLAPAQYAALAALEGPHGIVETMTAAYRERRDGVCARLERGGVQAHRPSGAFYVWADVRSTGMTSRDFAFHLLRTRGVAVAPGSAFGAHGEGFIRLSLATDPDLLYEATDRIVAALSATAGADGS